jgi:hypothetical protein
LPTSTGWPIRGSKYHRRARADLRHCQPAGSLPGAPAR